MKNRYKNEFDKRRRSLFKTIAAAGISKGLLNASPLIGGLMIARNAEALGGITTNKSVCIYTPGGAIRQFWEPSANFDLPSMSAGLNGVKNDCLFLRRMSHSSAGHGRMPTIFNNGFTGDSFEVNMGRILGQNNPFPYINLGVLSNGQINEQGQSQGQGAITRDAGREVTFEDNPFAVFNRLFGNGGNTGGGTGGGIGNKQSVIDAHKLALDAIKNKLGTYERERLDRHLTSIEETEQRLINTGGGGGGPACNAGPAPAEFARNSTTFTRQANLQADIISLAFSCNLTSSASIAWGNHQCEFSIPQLNFKGLYHQSIHGGQGGPTYIHYQEMRGHLSTLTGYLIQKLKDDGILNDTLVTELSDMGNGDAHGQDDCPFMFAGGGGTIRTGNVSAGNSSYNNLNVLETAATALGATQHPAYQGYASSIIPGVIA